MFASVAAKNAARYIQTEIAEPINSTLRQRRAAVIPPISFVGELEIGISGFWYPTTTIELNQGSITASADGTESALVYIFKEEPGTGRPLTIVNFSLTPTQQKAMKRIGGTIVTPYDKVFAASYTDSGHGGVVIQLVGEMMS